MKILVSNDDGVHAPGIIALADALREIAEVTVVAPEGERSGSSSALTLDRPLRVHQVAERVWAVNGTPADCVYLSMNGLFGERDIDEQQIGLPDLGDFDLVVSGINSGANLGDDVLYSGTVGAAFEGRLMKQPAIAVSLTGQGVRHYQSPIHYRQAAAWVRDFVKKGIPTLPPRHILNINIPDVDHYRGVEITHLGRRSPSKPITAEIDPRGRRVYWIGLAGQAIQEQKAQGEIDSDFSAIARDCISITPIQMDSTNYTILSDLAAQLQI